MPTLIVRIRRISRLPNRLASQTSPYLLQHKDNPVDWYPWGPEALADAKRQGRPILLSVGYAACHWCHVMAHECFENPAIAGLMNELFINIKVDREERPDLDAIYQTALALTGQQGGWPLTMFLTSDGKPFAGGTYFPPERRYGRPGLPDVLRQVADIWRDEPERIAKAQGAIMERLEPVMNPHADGELSIAALDDAAMRILATLDPYSGGFGEAPKFPNTPLLELLWRTYLRTGKGQYRSAVELTLNHMCQGGIYDHLGGGFARYSVDAEWLTPHFEKMLYDNAALVSLMTLVWKTTGSALLARRIDETIQWLMREMHHLQGGFFSSLDADSEGHEGKFYLWSKAEIQAALGAQDAALFCSVYGVTDEGNFEGANILNRLGAMELGDEGHEARLAEMGQRLLATRAHRVRPGLDDKILADWNGLAIEALARAGGAFGRPDWTATALRAIRFVAGQLIENKRLSHAWREGRRAHIALAEDYANLISAALALYGATAEPGHLHTAETWAAELAERYAAPDGGYYQSSDDADDVILRSRTIWDNATPPANATMLANHARLYALTGIEAHKVRAEAILSIFAGAVLRNPGGAASLLNSFELFLATVTVGLAAETPAGELARIALASGDPNIVIAWADDGAPIAANHPLAGKRAIGGAPTAYVCRGPVCSAPVTTPSALKALVKRAP